MSRAQHSNLDMQSIVRILNLPDGVGAQEPATVAQLNAAIEGLAPKDSVRVSTQGNVNLAAPGATIDGITMVAGDRVLVRLQTAASENGIYVWNGPAVPATRSLDANTAAELRAATTTVEEGSNNAGVTDAGNTYRQTSVNFTLGTSPVNWVPFGNTVAPASEVTAGIAQIATQAKTDAGTDDLSFITPLKLATWANRTRKVSVTIGDGSSTQFDVTHNFNTDDVLVSVRRLVAPKDDIGVDVGRPTANAVRINFQTAPTSNQFRVTVLG